MDFIELAGVSAVLRPLQQRLRVEKLIPPTSAECSQQVPGEVPPADIRARADAALHVSESGGAPPSS
eukprot:3916919-Pyramimonas_sp.AAC.1